MGEKTQGNDVYFAENTLTRIYNLLYPYYDSWSFAQKYKRLVIMMYFKFIKNFKSVIYISFENQYYSD